MARSARHASSDQRNGVGSSTIEAVAGGGSGAPGDRVGLLWQQRAIRPEQLIFVERSRGRPRYENLPDAGAVPQAHLVTAAIPAIEVTDHRDAPGIRRPDCEAHTRHAVDDHRVRAEALREIAMPAFSKQIDIELTEQRSERVRVVRLLRRPAPIDLQQIGAGPRARADEHSSLADRPQLGAQGRLIARDRGDGEGARQHRANDVARRGAVPAEHRERIEAAPFDHGLQRRREAQIVIHRLPP